MALPKGVLPELRTSPDQLRPKQNGGKGLVAVARTDRDALAADRTTATQHGSSGLCLHARPKAVRLGAAVAVRLKCALGHKSALLSLTEI